MIREASVTDIPFIRKMAAVVFPETYRTILSPDQLEWMMDWMYSESSLMDQMLVRGDRFFVEEDGHGYVSFRHDRDNVYHLEKIYVLPEYHKTGLGRRLFDTVVSEIGKLAGGGPFTIELNVNRSNPSVGFYEHLGMRKDRSGDFPIGNGYFMNDYIMAKDFNTSEV